MQDHRGNLVPEANVKPQHKLEDELVRAIAAKAQALSEALAEFKAWGLSEVGGFRELVARQYDTTIGGKKGNVTLSSYDGALQVQVAISESLTFGPELQAAKALIDACVQRWSEGANENMQALVDHAFQVNQVGRIDTQRVLGLRRLDIDDAEWNRAMEAIHDALRVTGSKTYLRVYRRDPKTEAKTSISLDLAGV